MSTDCKEDKHKRRLSKITKNLPKQLRLSDSADPIHKNVWDIAVFHELNSQGK